MDFERIKQNLSDALRQLMALRLIVSSPTLPSTFARLCARWKAITAACVPSPKMPSTLPR